MASPFAKLRSFAQTRQGKVALGGTAVGGVVVAGLVTRRKSKGDPSAPGADTSSAPPYAVSPATGTSGTNTDAFPTINSGGIDVGQFEEMLSSLGRLADAADQTAGGGTAATDPPVAESNPTAEMEQQIRDLFQRYNVSPSYTYSPTSETADQRIARLAREQLAGTRSWDSLTKSVSQLSAVSSGRAPAPTR